jgi:type IX secretion system PorP/SprF family membrane protein
MIRSISAFIAFLLIGLSLPASAQQDPLYSQYINNPVLLSPAFAGLNDDLSINVLYRNQWTGFEGNPQTFTTGAHMALKGNTMGAGLQVIRDVLGVTENTEVMALYSYRIRKEDKSFSFGLQGGMVSLRTESERLNLFTPGDPAFTNSSVSTAPNIGVGLLFRTEKLTAGFSVPRMLNVNVDEGLGSYELYNRTYYLHGSYLMVVSKRVRVKPSVLLRAVEGSSVSYDVLVPFNLDERYTAGIYTRSFNSLGLMLQALLKDKYKIAYSAEIPSSNSVGTSYLTHEIMVGLSLETLTAHQRTGGF